MHIDGFINLLPDHFKAGDSPSCNNSPATPKLHKILWWVFCQWSGGL